MFEVVIVSQSGPSVVIGTADSADAATVAFHAALRERRHEPAPREVQLRDLRAGTHVVLRMTAAPSLVAGDRA
jgi:hypothetical protein